MKTVLLLPIAAALVALQGCDQESHSESTSPQTTRRSEPQQNPAEQLKWQMAHAVGDDHSQKVWSGLRYDVTTTNSLVTPYEGIIEVTLTPERDKPDSIIMYRVKIGHQEGQWRITDMQASNGWGLQPVERNDKLNWYKAFAQHYGFQ